MPMPNPQHSDRLGRRIPQAVTEAEAALIEDFGQDVLDFIDRYRYTATTVKGYQDRWDRFQRYCADSGVDALTADEYTVLAFLIEVGDIEVDAGGCIVSAGASSGHLVSYKAAIAWKHRSEGYVDPTNTDAVTTLIAAARALDGDVQPAVPLTREALADLLSSQPGTSLEETVLVAWATTELEPPLSLAAMGQVTADDIVVSKDAVDVTIESRVYRIERSADPMVCAATAWSRLRDRLQERPGTLGETLEAELAPEGPALISTRLRKAARQHSLSHLLSGHGVTTTIVAEASHRDRIQLSIGAMSGGAEWFRDRALVLVGYHGALRPGEAVALRSSDLVPVAGHGTALLIRFSKGDPEGAGEHVGIRPDPEPILCAETALHTWCAYLGAEPGQAPGQLMFPSSRSDTHLRPGAVRLALRRLCRRHGSECPYSGYSLRRGRLQERARVVVHPRDAANAARHRRIQTQLTYVRGSLQQVRDDLAALLDSTAEENR